MIQGNLKQGNTIVGEVHYRMGKDGEDGYSPVRGVDYWTEEDQKAVVDEAVAQINEKPEWKAFADCTWAEIAKIAKNYDPSEYWKVGDVKRIDFGGWSVPVVIIGFHHDDVVDMLGYGKKKAGLTLQLGADRARNGDTYSGVYEPNFGRLPSAFIDANGLYKSPNKLVSTGVGQSVTEVATWWGDSAVRTELQMIFHNTELADLIVPVEKVTSKFCNENNGYENWFVTHDRVFLLSETELYGKQYLSPAIEGHMYEYYAKGASRYFWGEEVLANKEKYLGGTGYSIWMRSSAQRGAPNGTAELNNSVQVRKATCRVYTRRVLRMLPPVAVSKPPISFAMVTPGAYFSISLYALVCAFVHLSDTALATPEVMVPKVMI